MIQEYEIENNLPRTNVSIEELKNICLSMQKEKRNNNLRTDFELSGLANAPSFPPSNDSINKSRIKAKRKEKKEIKEKRKKKRRKLGQTNIIEEREKNSKEEIEGEENEEEEIEEEENEIIIEGESTIEYSNITNNSPPHQSQSQYSATQTKKPSLYRQMTAISSGQVSLKNRVSVPNRKYIEITGSESEDPESD